MIKNIRFWKNCSLDTIQHFLYSITMAHKRKDTYTSCIEWAKHLKPEGKRMHNKAERRAAKRRIYLDYDEHVSFD
jgi:hypothetical protein